MQRLAVLTFQFDERTPRQGSARPNMADSSRRTVIICEDDPDLLRAFGLTLRSKFEIVSVSSGSECIRKYSEIVRGGKKVDAILLDYRLADTTGDKVAARVKSLDGTIVILISAYDIDNRLLNSWRACGYISMFLRKPLSMERLGAILETSLREGPRD